MAGNGGKPAFDDGEEELAIRPEQQGNSMGDLLQEVFDVDVVYGRQELLALLPQGIGAQYIDYFCVKDGQGFGIWTYKVDEVSDACLQDHFSRAKGLPQRCPGHVLYELMNLTGACVVYSRPDWGEKQLLAKKVREMIFSTPKQYATEGGYPSGTTFLAMATGKSENRGLLEAEVFVYLFPNIFEDDKPQWVAYANLEGGVFDPKSMVK